MRVNCVQFLASALGAGWGPPWQACLPRRFLPSILSVLMLLKDQVALITGSGRGIGRAIAHLFAKEGAAVFLTARTDKELASTTGRSEEHTSELQSLTNLVCRLLLEKKKKKK